MVNNQGIFDLPEGLAEKLYEPREAEAMKLISKAYGALNTDIP